MSIDSSNGNVAITLPLESKLNIYSTDTLSYQYGFDMPIRPFCNSFSSDGSLLVCGIAVPSPEHNVEKGQIAFIDNVDHVIRGYIELDKFPQGILSSSEDQWFYVSGGASIHNPGRIYKIDALNQEIVAEAHIDDSPMGFALNHDDTKLYVIEFKLYGTKEEIDDGMYIETAPYFHKLWVFDTSDLSPIIEIKIDCYALDIIRGDEGQLIISHGFPSAKSSQGNNACLTIINTKYDTVDHEIYFPDIGFGVLAYDSTQNILYSSIHQKISGEWEGSKSVAKVNMSDETMSLIPVGGEEIGYIILTPDGSRLYAQNEESNRIYCVDF